MSTRGQFNRKIRKKKKHSYSWSKQAGKKFATFREEVMPNRSEVSGKREAKTGNSARKKIPMI